jgi:ribosomal 30S subunit maturation factor RimM
MSEYIHIGKIVAAHGLTGHLILEHALGKPIPLKALMLFLLKKMQLVLFLILFSLHLQKPKV